MVGVSAMDLAGQRRAPGCPEDGRGCACALGRGSPPAFVLSEKSTGVRKKYTGGAD